MDVTSIPQGQHMPVVRGSRDVPPAGLLGEVALAETSRRRDRRPRGGRREPKRRPRPPKLYRVGEVVDYSGLSRQTVHNYTTMGMLREASWTEGGHRLYDESVFERLDEIADLKAQGKGLREIREYFARMDARAEA